MTFVSFVDHDPSAVCPQGQLSNNFCHRGIAARLGSRRPARLSTMS